MVDHEVLFPDPLAVLCCRLSPLAHAADFQAPLMRFNGLGGVGQNPSNGKRLSHDEC
jgi:hypothetical protein